MFGLLTCLSLSASQIRLKPTSNAAFDLVLIDNTVHKALTKSGYQVYVRFNGVDYKFDSPKSIIRNSKFAANLNFKNVDDAVSVEVSVENKNTGELPIQVGVYADFTKTELTPKIGNNAIVGQANGKQHLIVIKGVDKDVNTYHDPSSVFVGNASSDSNIPIFADGVSTTTLEQDSAYAFSWNENIARGATLKCKFLVYPNISVSRGPFIYFKMEDKYKQYPSDFNFTFDVVSYDEGSITFNKEHCPYMQEQPQAFQATSSTYMKSYIVRGHYDDGATDPQFTCTLTATNSGNSMSSQETTLTFYKQDRNPPSWSWEESSYHKPKKVGDDMSFIIHITDERQVEVWTSVHYNYPGNPATVVPTDERYFTTIVTQPTGTYSGRITLNTLNDLHLGAGNHVVVLTFKDPKNNVNQDIFKLTIKLTNPDAPVVRSISPSPHRVAVGEEIAIIGEITNSQADADINISAYWNSLDSTPIEYDPIQAGSEPTLFSLYYTIPSENNKPEANTIFIKFVSKGNVQTISNVTVYIPQPNPDTVTMAKIVDISANLNSTKSCFNLHYIDRDNKSHPMSNNDEGFYVAYRFRDIVSNTPKQDDTHYVTKAGGFQSSANNLTVEYFNDTAPHTGYFQARFKVTNNDYFDQKIDLSVFVDSNFGRSNQVIEMSDDDKSMIVSDEDNNLYYTVYKLYDNSKVYPEIEVINFAPNITRKSPTEEMDYSEMPFFTNIDIKSIRKYIGLDAMYSMGWREEVIRAGTSRIFTLTFAGYDKIKSPSNLRVTVLSEGFDRAEPNTDELTIIEVNDDNIGETLEYEIKITGHDTIKGEFTVESAKQATDLINKSGLTPKFNSGTGPFFNVSVLVKDKANTTPTSEFQSYFVDKAFDIEVNKIKDEYFPDDRISLSGKIINATKPVYIMYQFGTTGREERSPQPFSGSTFKFEISFPPEVTPSLEKRLIRVWAKNVDGMLSEHNRIIAGFTGGEPVWNQSFLLTVKDKPVLHELGISKKKAQPGQEMLAYAVVNDTQYGRFIEIVYQFGTDDSTEWHSIDNERGKLHYDSVITTPFAFFWKVPSNAQVGKTYDVKFKARDASGLLSDETVTKTLVIAN